MENIDPTNGSAPLSSVKGTKTSISEFSSLDELLSYVADHLFVSPQAAESIKGDDGEKGDQGDQGLQGEQGVQGEVGGQGKSAYDVWLDDGNEGTEKDFLADIKGDPGPPPSAEEFQTIDLASTETFKSVPGSLSTIIKLVYDDGSGNPEGMTPPATPPAIGPIIDLTTGFVKVFFTAAIPDNNFKIRYAELTDSSE